MRLQLNKKFQCERSKEGHCSNSDCKYKSPYSSEESQKYLCTINGLPTELNTIEVEKDRSLTFSERFLERHKRDTIWCTVWDFYCTFMEFYKQALCILGKEGFSFPIGLIYDGYWLVFLSPFVLAYWILLLPMWVVFSMIWTLLGLLFIPIGLWSLLFELPASLLNKKELEYWKGKEASSAV